MHGVGHFSAISQIYVYSLRLSFPPLGFAFIRMQRLLNPYEEEYVELLES
jgi:hypothetical protein